MRPFLIVEDEGLVGCRPEGEGATRNSNVARAVRRIQRRPGGPGIDAGKARTRAAKGVQDEGEVFGVHVLMERGEGVEIRLLRARLAGVEARQAADYPCGAVLYRLTTR